MIHAILVCYENPEQTLTRWRRDVCPAVAAALVRFDLDRRPLVTVVDNSRLRSDSLNAFFGMNYHWMGGENVMYGPAINYAVRRLFAPASIFTVYACTKHGQAFDPTWICDLLAPMIADPAVGLTGCLWGSNSPAGVAQAIGKDWPKERYRNTDPRGPDWVPQHIQGGVFAARTEVLLRCPYHDDIKHLYTDHTLTWDAMNAGYKCVDVPSVRSIWRDRWRLKHSINGVKYLHDEEHT